MTLRYLALGDSYTIGEGVSAHERWPVQLAQGLREAGIAMGDPRIIATTGWTTGELLAAMDADEPLGEWDFVSLLIGVNNQYRGCPLDDYERDFVRLLERAIALAGARPGKVLVLSIPDWGATPFAAASGQDRQRIADEIDTYNAAAQAICDGHGVALVDITGLSRRHGAEPAMLAEDGLHPSAAMHSQWTAAALPTAIALLAADGALRTSRTR